MLAIASCSGTSASLPHPCHSERSQKPCVCFDFTPEGPLPSSHAIRRRLPQMRPPYSAQQSCGFVLHTGRPLSALWNRHRNPDFHRRTLRRQQSPMRSLRPHVACAQHRHLSDRSGSLTVLCYSCHSERRIRTTMRIRSRRILCLPSVSRHDVSRAFVFLLIQRSVATWDLPFLASKNTSSTTVTPASSQPQR
jgi:hypothetical protein